MPTKAEIKAQELIDLAIKYKENGQDNAADAAAILDDVPAEMVLTLRLGPAKRTPLHYAVEADLPILTNALLEASPECIDIPTADGNTAMHIAVAKSSLKAMEILMKHKQITNALNNDGVSPLILAVRLGKDNIVERLVYCGVEVDATDKAGKTAMDHARTADIDSKARNHMLEVLNC